MQQAAVQQAAAQGVQVQVELAAVRAEAAAQQRLQQAMVRHWLGISAWSAIGR